jgi:2-methylcitrate dehydratase PrpD
MPKISVKVDHALKTERGPIVISMQTKTHGEVSCRIDHVPGSPGAPLSEAEVQEKFQECFRLGVCPLTDAQFHDLSQRVRDLVKMSDMSTFLNGIC